MLLLSKMANPPPMTSYNFSAEAFLQKTFPSIPLEPPYTFSLGIASSSSFGFGKEKKRLTVKQKQKLRRTKTKPKPKPPADASTPVKLIFRTAANAFSFRRTVIIPPHIYTPAINGLLNANPYNSAKRKRLIQHYRDYASAHRSELAKSPLAGLFADAKPTYFENLSAALEEADDHEGRLRGQLRPFFHSCRLRRLARRRLNSDDPATLSPPRIPIVLYDWSAKGVWCYEAASLRDQVSAELTHVSYEFPEAQAPRNPLTNKEFTYGQMLSVVQQLRAAVKTNSLVEGYAELGFKIGVFQAVYWRKIRLRHFERNYRDERSDDFQHGFAIFMEAMVFKMIKMDQQLIYNDLFRWAVKYALREPYMQEWKGLYRQYQITEILYKDDSAYDRMIRSVYGQASILFQRKREREELKELWMSSVVSPSASENESEAGEEYADF